VLPAVIVAGPVFKTDTSAEVPRVTDAVELLFARFGSPVADETSAVLVIVDPVVPETTLATRVNTAVVPDAIDARLHVIVAPVVQLNVGPEF
jgi:hypothetical protein